MKLAVNGWRIHGRRTGIGRYLLNVVRYWTADMVAGRFEKVSFYTPQPVNRQDVPLPANVQERVLRSTWPMLVWENLLLAPASTEDVLFCPSYSRPLFTRGRTVVTTHDATSKLYPELYPLSVKLFYNHLYGWSSRHATLVITTTEAARRDIVRSYGVPASRIRVVHLAPAEIFRPLPGDSRVSEIGMRYLGSSVPFFFFVGKMSGRRNLRVLLEAFAEMKRRTPVPHKLLIVGLNTQNLNVPALINEMGLERDVVHRDSVSDEDLVLLYNAAEALVMPTVYETLSFPVMEAQATGTPVICTDTPGLREITGGAALLIARPGVRELVEPMSRLATDPSLRRQLAERGLAQAQSFSWQRCSAETLSVLHEAARFPLPGPVFAAKRVAHDD